jgi:hypothetical protein
MISTGSEYLHIELLVAQCQPKISSLKTETTYYCYSISDKSQGWNIFGQEYSKSCPGYSKIEIIWNIIPVWYSKPGVADGILFYSCPVQQQK